MSVRDCDDTKDIKSACVCIISHMKGLCFENIL